MTARVGKGPRARACSSSTTTERSVEAGMAAGAKAYLEKPVEFEILERELRAAIGARPAAT